MRGENIVEGVKISLPWSEDIVGVKISSHTGTIRVFIGPPLFSPVEDRGLVDFPMSAVTTNNCIVCHTMTTTIDLLKSIHTCLCPLGCEVSMAECHQWPRCNTVKSEGWCWLMCYTLLSTHTPYIHQPLQRNYPVISVCIHTVHCTQMINSPQVWFLNNCLYCMGIAKYWPYLIIKLSTETVLFP